MSEQRFDRAAATWDEKPQRRLLTAAIAGAMQDVLIMDGTTEALEIGCGTGLLTCALAHRLKSIVAIDTSQGMLAVLAEKIAALGLANVQGRHFDLLSGQGLAGRRFSLVYSAMTLHHVKDAAGLLAACFDHLSPGGTLALADLEEEDGSFHDDMGGVEHCGFAPDALRDLAVSCGFVHIRFRTIHHIRKEKKDGRGVDYPVFLMTAVRP